MKILVLQDFLRSGGTERQAILLANGFAGAGHATTLLTFRPGGLLASNVASTVSRHALQPFDLHLDWFAPALPATIRRHSPDVVLCMGRMANCRADYLQTEFPGIAVIATMRTGKALPPRFVRSLRTVRHVVANSRDARDTLVRDYSIPSAKISVIHNALVFPPVSATSAAAIARESLRSRHGASRTTTVLLCVAMFRPEKNQRALIESLASLRADLDWQLWLVGDGTARAECERLAGKKRIGLRVKFLGFQRNPSSLYAAADIAVHASATEALSNFLVEAQAHGLPAVVYQAQGMEECFIPNETGWVISRGNSDAFRAAILRVASESPETRAQRSAAAQAFARETFDPDRQVAAYLDLFSRLIRQDPVAREARP